MDGTSKMDTHTSNRTKAKVQEKPLGKKNWTLSVRHVCEVLKLFWRSKSCAAVESSQFSWHSPENTNHVFGTVRPHINTKGKTIFHIHNERDKTCGWVSWRTRIQIQKVWNEAPTGRERSYSQWSSTEKPQHLSDSVAGSHELPLIQCTCFQTDERNLYLTLLKKFS